MEQLPSVGRIVHYKSYGTPNGEYMPECRAAIVTAVGTNGYVSLCVMNPTGQFFNESVRCDPDGTGGSWHWPEQVGLART